MITKENIKVVCSTAGVKLYWKDIEVTSGAGLNVGINTLGLWTDSSKAEWKILDKRENGLTVKVVFNELPLSQVWTIEIVDCIKVSLNIEVEIEEHLHIDEFRVLCLTNPGYKTWIQDFQQGNFPRPNKNWQGPAFDNARASLVGVRFPAESNALPSLILKHQNNQEQTFSFVQRPPSDIDAHIIGFRCMSLKKDRDYCPGQYHLFSGLIELSEEDNLLDQEIESLRQKSFNITIEERVGERKIGKKPKVLLVNLPWQKKEKWGVRAGSRWPHIKDRSENDYLPFPFFLAYSTSLLQKNGIESDIIDAIADSLPEQAFIKKLSCLDFNVLVIETSIPSFAYDLNLIRKISSDKFRIILCGPNPAIYDPEFLKRNNNIDFVLHGEYEFTLLELVEALSSGETNLSHIQGLLWKDEFNNIVKNLPREPFGLGLLPWPYRGKSLPMHKYWDLPGDIPHPSAQLVASRGCPFGCNFCLWPQLLFGSRVYRFRAIKDIADEMEYLIKDRGFKSVYFDDDTFNVGKSRMLELCDEIINRGLNKTPWAIMAKVDLMDEEILKKMKEAGLCAVKYGMENASQKIVDKCGKSLDLRKAIHVIKFTKSLGVNIHLTFTFGLPGETKKTIKDTIFLACKLDPHSVQFSMVTPFPGTDLYNELDKQGRILSKDFSMYDGHYNCVFQPDNLSPNDLVNAKQYAYRVWIDHKRKKRGFLGSLRKLCSYIKNNGFMKALCKAKDYFKYLFLNRNDFIGKI